MSDGMRRGRQEQQHEGAGRRPDRQRMIGDHGDARPGQPVPPGHAEEAVTGQRAGGRGHAEAGQDDVQHAVRVVEPVGPLPAEVADERVDHAGGAEHVQEQDRHSHRAGDRREVVGGAEEAASGQPLPAHDQRQAQRERGLHRHHDDHVVQVVAQALAQLLLGQAGLGEQRRVVPPADRVHAAANGLPMPFQSLTLTQAAIAIGATRNTSSRTITGADMSQPAAASWPRAGRAGCGRGSPR